MLSDVDIACDSSFVILKLANQLKKKQAEMDAMKDMFSALDCVRVLDNEKYKQYLVARNKYFKLMGYEAANCCDCK